MKNRIFKILTLTILLTAAVLPAVAQQVFTVEGLSLWEKAVEYYRLSEELRPHKMTVLSKTYNDKGEPEKTEELYYALSYTADGETNSKLIRSTEDGEDVTEKRRKNPGGPPGGGRGGGSPGDSEGFDRNPLDPALQNEVSAFDTGLVEYKNGKRSAVWNFRLKLNDKYSAAGNAWISAATGEVVSMEYQLEPTFPFVEEMIISMNYKLEGPERMVLEKLIFKGRINFIVMKKTFEASTRFSDYR